jgi:hypothetical protein
LISQTASNERRPKTINSNRPKNSRQRKDYLNEVKRNENDLMAFDKDTFASTKQAISPNSRT